MCFVQVIEVFYVSYATGLSNPVNPDPLLLHDLLHVHVPGEPPRLLHRGLRRQEERDADQEPEPDARMGSADCHRVCKDRMDS